MVDYPCKIDFLLLTMRLRLALKDPVTPTAQFACYGWVNARYFVLPSGRKHQAGFEPGSHNAGFVYSITGYRCSSHRLLVHSRQRKVDLGIRRYDITLGHFRPLYSIFCSRPFFSVFSEPWTVKRAPTRSEVRHQVLRHVLQILSRSIAKGRPKRPTQESTHRIPAWLV